MKKILLIAGICIAAAAYGAEVDNSKTVTSDSAVKSEVKKVFSKEVDDLKSESMIGSLKVSWNLGDDAEISKVEVMIKDNNGGSYKKPKVLEKNQKEITFDKLEPLGTYSVKVRLVNGAGEKSKGKEITEVIKHKYVVWDELEGKKMLIYLPDGYDKEDKKYPVMYMFDGQNLFSNNIMAAVEWQIDEVVDRLIKEQKVEKMIVVGVYNAAELRHEEYIPYMYDKGKQYTEFFVKKLIPYIDSKYKTNPVRENRGIMGSSLGGLMAIYMVNHYSEYFSMAGSVSPHDPWKYCEMLETGKKDVKVWVDAGTGEYAKGKPGYGEYFYNYVECARFIADELIKKGAVYGKDVAYYEVKDATHNELDWSKRVEYPFILFKGKPSQKVVDFKIDVDSTIDKNRTLHYFINPVADFDNGMRETLYTLANYKISGSGKINDRGEFDIGKDNEAEITVSFQGIEKKVKVTKEQLDKLKPDVK